MFNYTLLILQTMAMTVNNSSNLNATELPQSGLYGEKLNEPMALQSADAIITESGVCYGELGCFPVDSPWVDTNRPVALDPEKPEKVNPRFCLFTRRTRDECQPLDYRDPRSILHSELIPTHRTYIIVHGFLEDGTKPWMMFMKKRLLKYWDCNVILVDWKGGSSPPYAQAVANIRLVGVIGAHLLAAIHKWAGHKTEYCHVIGHSLGAHIAGYMGSTLKSRFNLTLGRISGMDPAAPHFSDTDPVVRLDPSDAIFVDVIHTDVTPFTTGGLGIAHPVGHLDFYPNGGETQPGCEESYDRFMQNSSFVQGLRRYLGCDHVKSYQFFIESINVPCEYTAIECDSWENFTAGNCFGCRNEINPNGRMCASMGFNAIKTLQRDAAERWEPFHRPDFSHVKLYTLTGQKARFCRTLYRMTIRISNSTESRQHAGESGKLTLKMDGILSKSADIVVFENEFFYPGKTYRRIIGDVQVGRLRSAKLSFKHVSTANPITWRIGFSTKIFVQNFTIDNLEEGMSVTLCPHKGEVVSSVAPSEFRSCSRDEDIIN